MKLVKNAFALAIVLIPLSCLSWAAVNRGASSKPSIPSLLSKGDYTAGLATVMAKADSVLVIDNSFNAPPRTILMEIAEPGGVRRLNSAMQFNRTPLWERGRCGCMGFPRIEWYEDGECIAKATMHHGKSLRWNKVGHDLRFTSEAQTWWKEFGNANEINMSR